MEQSQRQVLSGIGHRARNEPFPVSLCVRDRSQPRAPRSLTEAVGSGRREAERARGAAAPPGELQARRPPRAVPARPGPAAAAAVSQWAPGHRSCQLHPARRASSGGGGAGSGSVLPPPRPAGTRTGPAGEPSGAAALTVALELLVWVSASTLQQWGVLDRAEAPPDSLRSLRRGPAEGGGCRLW